MTEKTKIPEVNILDLIESGVPIIFYRTVEPNKAEEKIKSLLMAEGRDSSSTLYIWKVNEGSVQCTPGTWTAPNPQPSGPRELLPALQQVRRATDSDYVGIFHNIRQYIKTPPVIQELIDASTTITKNNSVIILLGTELELPPELENVVSVLDCDLPSKEEITDHYTDIIAAWSRLFHSMICY